MRQRTWLWAAAIVVLFGTLVRPAGQAPVGSSQTPPATPILSGQGVDRAARTVATHCAGCHGDALQGARAASLLDDQWSYGGDDEALVRTIRLGRAEAGMPAFGGTLDDPAAREIVFMIRSLAARAKGRPATRATPVVDGVLTSARHRFRIETLTDALETPWGMAVLPDGRILVTERPGRLRVIEHGRLLAAPVEGVPKVWTRQDGGLFDVEIHPKFAQNGWVYLAFAEQRDDERSMTVIVRGRLEKNALVDLVTLARWPDEWYAASNVHYGARFIFDRDGYLYFSIGDRGRAERAQDLSAPVGKIHRVTESGAPAPGNPFANQPGALATIWSYGNRNPQGFAWHPVTGELWETEHGPRGGDEVNVIQRGRNYGWPVVSFGILDTWVSPAVNGTATEATFQEGMEPPIRHYTPSPGISPLLFYTGDAFPGWKHDLLVGMMRDEELKRLTIDGHTVVSEEVLFRGLGRVRDIAQAADGSLYVALATPGASVSDTTAGRIVRLTPVRDTLDIYVIDTEGGQATLYVSPSGQTMLVDTGNAGARDLDRIVEVLTVAGVTRLDHLFLTHYHGDHYGNLIALATRFRVGRLYDHGSSIEADRPNIQTFEALYADLVRTTPRAIVKPGDTIPLSGVETTVVVSHSQPLTAPLAGAPGAGAPNGACAAFTPRDEAKVDPDNHYSAGFVMAYGKFRTINLGDLTWSREFALMCPNNPIGTVDLYLTTHHGLDQSGSPAFVHAIRPRVAVMNNGSRKGGAVQSFQTLESSPGLEDIWQLHWSYAGGVEHNTTGVMIANVDDPAQLAAVVGAGAATPTAPAPSLPAGPAGNAAHAPAHYLKVSARADGSFTVTNSRTGYTKAYAARP